MQPTEHGINCLYYHNMKENNVKFMHQSLCNPPKLSLLAAIHRGFLCGTPHLTTKAIIKYLPPSPATSKGHMKCPHQELCSRNPKFSCLTTPTSALDRSMPNLIPPANHDYNFNKDKDLPSTRTTLINSIVNIFYFRAFADKPLALSITITLEISHLCCSTGMFASS
jgi:hypothetical protein